MTARAEVRLAKLESGTPGNEWKEYRNRPVREWPGWALTAALSEWTPEHQAEVDYLVRTGVISQQEADRERADARTIGEWESKLKDVPYADPLHTEYTAWLTARVARMDDVQRRAEAATRVEIDSR